MLKSPATDIFDSTFSLYYLIDLLSFVVVYGEETERSDPDAKPRKSNIVWSLAMLVLGLNIISPIGAFLSLKCPKISS